jgi:hypothetical protein
MAVAVTLDDARDFIEQALVRGGCGFALLSCFS